jgi:hypothetical protein
MAQMNYRLVSQPYVGTEADLQDVLSPARTSAQLASASNRINTEDKFVGKMVFDSTLGIPVWASGASAAAAWTTNNPTLATEAGAGITDGTGTIYESSVSREGGIVTTQILIDMTGLKSATSDVDIIGEAVTADPSHLGQITAAQNGTILGGDMQCLEVPASLDDVDLYTANEATGAHEDGIATLTASAALVTAGAAWTLGLIKAFSAVPPADDHLYLVNGAADTADDFTAGKFLIKLYGYDA